MSYGPFTLKDERSLGANFSKIEFDLTNSISKKDEILPDHLLKFSSKKSWDCISVEDILKGNFQRSLKNIYIDKIILKTHDPNLIFDRVYRNLSVNNFFSFRVVTAENIKLKIKDKHSPNIFIFYYIFHFLIRRVLPKLKGFRGIFRLLNVRVDISKAEIIGRLIYKGFKIIDLVENDYETIITTQPSLLENPSKSNPIANEGFIFKMKRLGKNGKKITVFKFRSMHPYAEYVQEYLHKTNGLEIGGKFKNDFRVSTGGQILRKYWIDELPMLYNLLRGDIKLIGVRPISEHYFSLYPEEAQAIRRMCKPGLLPPFYADMPSTFEDIVQSEVNYLKAYEKAPLRTDLEYLRRILTNIIVNKVRSK